MGGRHCQPRVVPLETTRSPPSRGPGDGGGTAGTRGLPWEGLGLKTLPGLLIYSSVPAERRSLGRSFSEQLCGSALGKARLITLVLWMDEQRLDKVHASSVLRFTQQFPNRPPVSSQQGAGPHAVTFVTRCSFVGRSTAPTAPATRIFTPLLCPWPCPCARAQHRGHLRVPRQQGPHARSCPPASASAGAKYPPVPKGLFLPSNHTGFLAFS